MNSQPADTKEPLDDALTEAEIQALIAERAEEGMECEVVVENGQKFLVCRLPPL